METTNKKKKSTGAFFTFENIIGESEEIKSIIFNSKLISDSPSTVLIEGESGTGKEVLAQAIHNYSIRRDNRFIAINCGAIPKNIIESELFGYEEGAFTGGKKGGNIGKIELAHKGTLFLDEIGDMPYDMQIKLLRVLQEGRITRVGGNYEIPVDMRVIAATNKKLREEVKKGRFREDLYYRLCVIPIRIPSLRDRRKDIGKLIDYFLEMKSLKLKKNIRKLDEELLNKLLNHNWPGNIRELENTIENIVNLNGKLSLDICQKDNEEDKEVEFCLKEKCPKYKSFKLEKEFNLATIEEKTIIRALNFNNQNISKTAKALGISRNTLYLKMKKYKIGEDFF
jgi:sigma-54 dependent transcriptional regulator, acetoin dehydrogenase operon transcriptional activator AcoR